MGALLIAGLCMAGAVLFMMARIDMRKFLGYSVLVDIGFTVLMLCLFMGTFSGIVAGAVAGLVLSVALTVLRKLVGYETLEVVRIKHRFVSTYKLRWADHEPEWNWSRS